MIDANSKVKYWAVNIITLILMIVIDAFAPLVIDDVWYAGGNENLGLLEGIVYAIAWCKDFFFTWSGRMVGNFFAAFMVVIPKAYYNVLNAVVNVAIGNLIYAYINPKQKYDYVSLALIYTMMWIFIPWYGYAVIWANGSTIYQWVLLFLMIFAYPYWKEYIRCTESEDSGEGTLNTGILPAVGMLLLGVLGGNSMEPFAGAAFLAFIAYVIYKKKKHISIRAWEITGLIGFLFGFGAMLLAPGNASRSRAVKKGILGDKSFFEDYAIRIIRETYHTCRHMSVLFGLAIAFAVIAWMLHKSRVASDASGEQSGKTKKFIDEVKDFFISERIAIVMIIIAFLSIYAMTASPAFACKIYICPTVLLIISIGCSIKRIMDNEIIKAMVSPAIKILTVFLAVFVLTQYVTAIMEMRKTGEVFLKDTYFVHSDVDIYE